MKYILTLLLLMAMLPGVSTSAALAHGGLGGGGFGRGGFGSFAGSGAGRSGIASGAAMPGGGSVGLGVPTRNPGPGAPMPIGGFRHPFSISNPSRFHHGRLWGYYPYWEYGGYGYGYGDGSDDTAYAEQPDNSDAEWLREQDRRRLALPRSAFVKEYHWPQSPSSSALADKARPAASAKPGQHTM